MNGAFYTEPIKEITMDFSFILDAFAPVVAAATEHAKVLLPLVGGAVANVVTTAATRGARKVNREIPSDAKPWVNILFASIIGALLGDPTAGAVGGAVGSRVHDIRRGR